MLESNPPRNTRLESHRDDERSGRDTLVAESEPVILRGFKILKPGAMCPGLGFLKTSLKHLAFRISSSGV